MTTGEHCQDTAECLYERINNGREIRVNACRGYGDTALIPETIEGLPVTELGPYVFSEGKRTAPAGEWTVAHESGKEPPLIEGNRLKTLALPSSVRKAGKYAFYNCHQWERLVCHSTFNDIGAGAFTGCKHLTHLDITMEPDVPRPGLKDILSELRQEVHVTYRTKEGSTRLVFPEFYEDAVENTPARIVSVKVYGSGHFYRYCFDGRDLQFKDYDAQFENLVILDREELAVEAAVGRLRGPVSLTAEARERYLEYLSAHKTGAASWFFKEQDTAGLKWLLDTVDFDENDLAAAIEAAGKAQAAEGLSVLMDYRHRKFRPKRRTFEL
ncbi:hypothetical protein B5E84_14100 [Lachnoclostridium sp. An14]|uniref:leucine-rich repeat protein n=1 Tax=Lachnoclostridium sp. An14 TaxID=1965562 RepID=UPI000B3766A5|nr:leucine-rich repeat protein [Lachnoclostridium sp. An14]OUQ15638.1 hypothetical protein B5E84_14100 [Lachnoclostridium sp. An14]